MSTTLGGKTTTDLPAVHGEIDSPCRAVIVAYKAIEFRADVTVFSTSEGDRFIVGYGEVSGVGKSLDAAINDFIAELQRKKSGKSSLT